jgi:hypothetical protein
VLLGGAGLVVAGAASPLLAACGGDDGEEPDARERTTSAPGSGGAGGASLVTFFDPNSSIVAGSLQRLTFGVGDETGSLIEDSPASLRFQLRDEAGGPVGGAVTVERHDAGLPRGYYPLTVTPPQPGTYEVVTTLDGAEASASFTAGTVDSVRVPGPGAAMPDLHTPTDDDARGVDPICTNDPPCPLHAVDLADARTTGTPIALLVSTPAYCQTAICGPVLDVLLDVREEFGGGLTSIHVEVYESAAEFEANPSDPTLAPAVQGLNLTFEPCLFLVGSDGRIAKRLDTIFDAVELRQELTALVG